MCTGVVLLSGVCCWCIKEVRMSRMTVTIDNALLEEAKEALGVETRAEAIRTALEEAVRRRRLALAIQQRGQFELRGGLSELRRLREE
jgi:Arc/MetJ family transcription regulator